ncbi:MAG: hypothetical protein WCF92_02405 [bacterium]
MNFENETRSENQEKLKPAEVITARGSVYKYLPDGRTQRYKKATEELSDPQDLLVFIPPWEKISTQVKATYPEIFKDINDEDDYNQFLLKYIHQEGLTIRPTDNQGKELKTNVDVEKAEAAFLAFIDKKDLKKLFYLPVSKEPKLDYSTYDTTKFVGEDGETYRQKHIGNKVTEIKY